MEKQDIFLIRLATALAIIRSKPNNLSGKEFAEEICFECHQSQQSWKEKFEKLKDELLHEKQENFICKQKLQSMPDLETVCLTPPCSCPSDQEFFNTEEENTLARHCHFFKCFLNLKSANKRSNYDRKPHASTYQDSQLCKETIRTSFGILMEYISMDLVKQYHSVIIEFIQLLMNVINKENLLGIFTPEIFQTFEQIIQKLMSHKNEYPIFYLMKVALALVHEDLTEPFTTLLLKEIQKCSSLLKKTLFLEGEKDFLWEHNNIVHVCELLSKVLNTHKKMCDTNFMKTLKHDLQTLSTDLFEKHPLFSFMLWKLCGPLHV